MILPGNSVLALSENYDLVIVGGGLVGASLAAALNGSDLKILLVESFAPDSNEQPSYDERTVALTYGARLIYSALGVWPEIESAGAQAISDIHISNRGHFGQTHLSHKHANTDALGYVVPTRNIGNILWKQLTNSTNIDLLCPASVVSLNGSESHCEVEIRAEKQTRCMQTRLCVLCDGGRSGLAERAGIIVDSADYDQTAVLSIVSVDRQHNGRAYERFTDEGPLALLPLPPLQIRHDAIFGQATKSGGDRYAVVWTSTDAHLTERLELTDEGFIKSLQLTFGDRAGIISNPSPRKAYPLKRSHCPNPLNGRILVAGNSAHTVHPVAGQGFNLGLRDVANLAEVILKHPADVGNQDILNRYVASRQHDSRMVEAFTHSLISLFSNENLALSLLRNIGLKALEYCPPMKRFLLRRTIGMHRQQSRIALGFSMHTDK